MDNQDPKKAPVSLAQNYDSQQKPVTQNVEPQPVVEQTPAQEASASQAPSEQTQPVAQETPAQSVTPVADVSNEKPAKASVNMEPLSDAPPAMTQKSPSSFQPDSNEPKKKPKKGKMFCTAIIVVILFLVLGVVGVGAYAYLTDIYIPVVSDIVDKIEAFIKGPEETAREVTEDVATTLIGTFLPLTGNSEGLMAVVAQSSVSEDYITNFLETNQTADSVKYSLDLTVDYNDKTQVSFDVYMEGAFNNKDKENPKMNSDFDASIELEEIPMDVDGEMRVIGDKSYLRLNSYPEIFDLYVGDITEKWINLESRSVEETTTMVTGGEKEIDKKEISNENVDNLMEFVTDDSVVKNAEFLPEETIEGNDCTCLKLYWNQEELKDVIKKYNEVYGYEYNEEEVSESVKNISKLEVEYCLGRKSEMVHRLGVKLIMTIGEIQMNLKLWDYGADINIEEPEDAVTFEEAMADSPMMDTARDYEVQAAMMDIMTQVETYYLQEMEYPESLSVLEEVETTYYGEEVHYEKTEDGYELWITLPSGEKYDLST